MPTIKLESVTVDDVLGHGKGICSGYVPGTTPGIYMEIWEFQNYVYMITCGPPGTYEPKLHPLGTKWK